MASLPFTKLHGTGNDFLVVDGRERQADWQESARRLCDRHFGVGADGLLVIAPSEQASVRMREFNPDGSEAEMSGNGIRCFAKYVLEREIARATESGLAVETGRGVLTVVPHWENGVVTGAKVDMGQPMLNWKDIPVNTYEAGVRDDRLLDHELIGEMGMDIRHVFFDGRVMLGGGTRHVVVTAVSMGNPHAVSFIETPVADYPLAEVGPEVEYSSAFPTRVNYSVANVLGRDRLAARTWERGVGETLACGTGACAMAVAARLHRWIDETVTVQVPGGELRVTWSGRGPVYLEGPAQEVFSGEWTE